MKLGLCTIAFQEKPLEEVIDIAADYGFDGIELWGKPPHLPAEYDEDSVKNIRDMVLRKGLTISAFGSYVNPLMDLHQKHFEEAFKNRTCIRDGSCENLVWWWSFTIDCSG